MGVDSICTKDIWVLVKIGQQSQKQFLVHGKSFWFKVYEALTSTECKKYFYKAKLIASWKPACQELWNNLCLPETGSLHEHSPLIIIAIKYESKNPDRYLTLSFLVQSTSLSAGMSIIFLSCFSPLPVQPLASRPTYKEIIIFRKQCYRQSFTLATIFVVSYIGIIPTIVVSYILQFPTFCSFLLFVVSYSGFIPTFPNSFNS